MTALLLAAVLALNTPDPALRDDVHMLELNHYGGNCRGTQLIFWDHRGWVIDWMPWEGEYTPNNPLFIEARGAYRAIHARIAIESWTPGIDPEHLQHVLLRPEWRKKLKRLKP